jgi:hypothetical protein
LITAVTKARPLRALAGDAQFRLQDFLSALFTECRSRSERPATGQSVSTLAAQKELRMVNAAPV